MQANGLAEPSERITITNDDGAFAFTALASGRYILWTTKNAYVPVWYGASRPGESIGAMSIVLAEGQTARNVVLKMPKGAVITGTVFDEDGQPAIGARMSVLQSRPDFQTGLRALVAVGSSNSSNAGPPVTDNRGVYRFWGLAAGTYYVTAEVSPTISVPIRIASQAEWSWLTARPGTAAPPPSPPRIYAPIFHPAAASQGDATPITVAAGDERAGVDIRLSLNPTATLDVRVTSGGPADILVFVLTKAEERSRIVASRRVDATGRALIPNLPPGRYTVVGRPAQSNSSPVVGATDVDLSGADQAVALELQSGPEVRGQVTLASGATARPQSLAGIRVSLAPAAVGVVSAMGAPLAVTDASGSFAFQNVVPERYRIRVLANGGNLGGGWVARSAMVGSTEMLDSPVEVRAGDKVEIAVEFASRLGELTGTLVDESGRAAPDYFVVAFTPDESAWVPGARRVVAMRPGLDGRFRVVNLPAGEYLVGAATDVDQYQWFDRDFLHQLSGAAVRLKIADGVVTTQNLSIARR